MKINVENFEGNIKELEQKIRLFSKQEEPEFARYAPDISFFKKALKPYLNYDNIIVIGHGGSITTTQGVYGALKNKKKLFIIDTPEPDFLFDIKKQCKKNDSVVVVVSKSGTTVDLLETMMYFAEFPMIIITNPEGGTLLEISKKMNCLFIEHPNSIGGRFSGFTSSTLVPSYLLGFDIDKLFSGAKDMYKKCGFSRKIKDNPALLIASNYYLASLKGKNEIFAPIYSKKMNDFATLLIQLIHESVCKEGKGMTVYSSSAPESQHHTNQRFFGGKKNVSGLFIVTDEKIQKNNKKIVVPKKLENITLRDGTLKDLLKNDYSKALTYEYLGVLEHSRKSKIPHIEIRIERCDAKELGEFVALWHYIAVYLSMFHGVNPFDQPEVEYSKDVSFKMRKK